MGVWWLNLLIKLLLTDNSIKESNLLIFKGLKLEFFYCKKFFFFSTDSINLALPRQATATGFGKLVYMT